MSIIEDELLTLFTKNNLPNSILIISENVERSTKCLLNFIEIITYKLTDLNSADNTDIIVIDLEEDATKISIDQIRKINNHFSKTSSHTPYKFCIVKNVDQMNNNASNSFLKILEDTPNNSFIFLITHNENSLLQTVKSRCFIFYDKNAELFFDYNLNLDKKICLFLNPEYRFDEKIKIVEEISSDKFFATKQSFIDIFKFTFSNLIKTICNIHLNNHNLDIPEFEELVLIYKNNFLNKKDLVNFYEEIISYMDHLIEFNLDMKQLLILILSKIEIDFKKLPQS